MNAVIWKQYGVRLGKILSNLNIAVVVFLVGGLIVLFAVPAIVVFKILLAIVIVICSLGLILLKEGFAEVMFSFDGANSIGPFIDAYAAALPAIVAVALSFSIGSFMLLICCSRKGERSVGRLVFSGVVAVLALIVLIALLSGGV